MTHNDDLEVRLKAVEDKLRLLEGSILIELKQFTEFHTHTLGGKVVWEFPPELSKKVLAAYKTIIERKRAEKVGGMKEGPMTIEDELEIFITPGEVKADE